MSIKPSVDLTGTTVNYLDVIGWMFDENRNKNQWLCKCICGKSLFKNTTELKNGKAKSCGCMDFYLRSKAKLKDLTGQRFGRLLVLERINEIFRTPKGVSEVKYKCLCDCGNIVEVFAGNLRKGNTQSCGCLNKELISKRSVIDLTNRKCGKLLVIKRVEDYVSPAGNTSTQWLCKCECGNYVVVNGGSLRREITKSCGCIRNSLGESRIEDILRKNNIQYKREWTFKDLRTTKGYFMRFDFAIFNSKELSFLIEYQGPQHYEEFMYNDKSFGKLQREETDPAKRAYCKKNNITLYEIRYYDDIESCMDSILGSYKDMPIPCQANE